MNQTHLSDLKFDELSLHESLKAGLADAGYTHCTPIQAEALPVALRGEDVAGQAQTGTGKTAAFLLAVFNQLLTSSPADGGTSSGGKATPRAIIIAPTRELAVQIHQDALLLGKHTALRMALAYGGTDYEKQRQNIFEGIDILVGTPGRLIDYLKQGVYTLDHIEVVVLDEADRMFDLGFIKDMRYMLRRMPPPHERLNMLFSATLSHRVMELAYEHMNDPRTITIESLSTIADNIRETVYYPSNSEKIPLMVGLLSRLEPGRTLVFTNTKHAAEKLGDWLTGNGHESSVLTGDVPQRKRESLLKAFSDGRCNILIATDVAARGLHIPDVSHVFNFDLPQDAEDYVHRIGRTARAGASGEAISFACEDYAFHLLDIEDYIGHPIARVEVDPELLPVLVRPKRTPKDYDTRGGRDRSRGGERAGRRPHQQRDDRTRPKPSISSHADERPSEPVDESLNPVTASEPYQGELAEHVPLQTSATEQPAANLVPVVPLEAYSRTTPEASVDIDADESGETADTPEPAQVMIARARAKPSKWNNPNIETPAIG